MNPACGWTDTILELLPSCRRHTPSRICGNDMHDAIAAFLEQTKEAGKHRRGLLLGIVEQHNSATIGFDPLNDKMKLLLWRHRIPVAGPKIRAENHDAA